MTEQDQEKADRALAVMATVGRRMHLDHGITATKGIRNNNEQRYALAYRVLVRLGLEPQLRRRYR